MAEDELPSTLRDAERGPSSSAADRLGAAKRAGNGSEMRSRERTPERTGEGERHRERTRERNRERTRGQKDIGKVASQIVYQDCRM
ncbi:MAG: hypothetical protein SangKO_077140 [Sandaracinaceae bacterium]